MSEPKRGQLMTLIAGEDLLTGDWVVVDGETGKLIRCPPGMRYLMMVRRNYRAGEVVEMPQRQGL